MKTSASGRALIEQREGRRLTAYRDSRGIWTIGVGHTGRMSPPIVTPGLTITEAECDNYLAADLAPVEAAIASAVKVPMSQNEFDALASLGFNIGAARLRRSSAVAKLNLGDVEGAAAAFMLWDHPAVLDGRRAAERAQFLEPDASHAAVVAARVQTLTAKAAAARSRAVTTQTAGGAMALCGAAATATVAHIHRPSIALTLFAIVLIGAGIDALVAWWHHARATTLTGNASKQAVTVALTP